VVIVTLLPDEYPCATSCQRFSDGIHWCNGILVPVAGAGDSVPTTVITPLVASVVRMLEIFAVRAGAATDTGAAHPNISKVSSPISTRRMKQLPEFTAR
jgi:hypothetical protein